LSQGTFGAKSTLTRFFFKRCIRKKKDEEEKKNDVNVDLEYNRTQKIPPNYSKCQE
jgi:hypothetical protein